MLKWRHVIDDLGSNGEVWSFYQSCKAFGSYGEDKGARGSDFSKSGDLVGRRRFGESVLKDRKKARAKAEEKKSLIKNRTTIIMLFLTKGVAL